MASADEMQRQQIDPCERYMQWVTSEAGIRAPKVYLKDMSDGKGRGLIAKETIWPNELIMHVPARSLIGVRNLFQHDTPISKFIKDLMEVAQWEWRDDDSIALFLIASLLLESNESESIVSNEYDDKSSIPEAEAVIVQNNCLTCDITSGTSEVFIDPASNSEDVYDVTLVSPCNVFNISEPTETSSLAVEFPTQSQAISFNPHVMMLPFEFSTPIFFEEHELNRMIGTNCREFSLRMREQMLRDWNDIRLLIRKYNSEQCQIENDNLIVINDNDFSLSMYSWALSVIYSRSTDFQKKDTGSGEFENSRVIVPLFDMINHDFDSDIYHAMDDNGDIRVYNGQKQIEAGKEILLSYGQFSNDKLLFVYGFCLENNPYSTVSIYAPIPASDVLYEAKAKILRERCGLNDVNQAHLLRYNSDRQEIEIPSTLMSNLRMIGVQSGEDFLKLSQILNNDEKIKEIPMLTYENELSALSALHSALDEMARLISLNLISNQNLKAASKSQEETATNMGTFPEEGHKDDSESINLKNIKILNWTERKILIGALAVIKERIDSLQ